MWQKRVQITSAQKPDTQRSYEINLNPLFIFHKLFASKSLEKSLCLEGKNINKT